MPVLLEETQKQLEDQLIESKLIEKEELDKVRESAKKSNTPLLQALVESGHITSEDLTKTIARVTHVPYVNLSDARVNPEVLNLLPQGIAERYMAVPLGEMQKRLVVAMLDAGNIQAVDFLSSKIGRPLKVYMASQDGIDNVLKQYTAAVPDEVLDNLGASSAAAEGPPSKTSAKAAAREKADNITTIVQDSPISKALAAIIEYAAKNRASDIHIEPLEKELKIRCRIDGVLREIMKLPKSTEPALISRIKILATMKIDEHRIPQDGGFTTVVGTNPIDLRIAISPVVWGEQCVIRLLDKSGTSLKLEQMGYSGRALRTIRKGIKNSNGMILTSGPTGSGKSTSMYALIQELKSDEVNIVTLEDPVEYKMSGINQIQVNSEVGLTFASGLRSILRQDPDIVMVGEIRDSETANLAVQAALTGHLVLSTLHTNSAAGILPRLLDMGIEPFLIASTVRTVIGQRLVRRITKPQPYEASPVEIAAINETIGRYLPPSEELKAQVLTDLGYGDLPLANQTAYTLFNGTERPDAPGGYKGRMGLYEVFEIDDVIQDLIVKRSASNIINQAALAQGMVSMREDGYLKALKGLTTIAEVNRVAAAGNA